VTSEASDEKGTACDSIYIKCPEEVNPQRQKAYGLRTWGQEAEVTSSGFLLGLVKIF
jgi:hypothetical protein